MSFTEDEKRKLFFIEEKELAEIIIFMNEWLEANRHLASPSILKAHDEAVAGLKKQLARIII